MRFRNHEEVAVSDQGTTAPSDHEPIRRTRLRPTNEPEPDIKPISELDLDPDEFGREDWHVAKITRAWQKTVPAIVETGAACVKAKDELGYGNWCKLFAANVLPFSQRTAEMLMSIAEHPMLSNPKNFSNLPAVVSTLYKASRVPGFMVARWLEDEQLTPKTKAADLKNLPGMQLPRLPELLKEFDKLTDVYDADGAASSMAEQVWQIESLSSAKIDAMGEWLKAFAKRYKAEWDAHRDEWQERADDEAEDKQAEDMIRKRARSGKWFR